MTVPEEDRSNYTLKTTTLTCWPSRPIHQDNSDSARPCQDGQLGYIVSRRRCHSASPQDGSHNRPRMSLQALQDPHVLVTLDPGAKLLHFDVGQGGGHDWPETVRYGLVSGPFRAQPASAVVLGSSELASRADSLLLLLLMVRTYIQTEQNDEIIMRYRYHVSCRGSLGDQTSIAQLFYQKSDSHTCKNRVYASMFTTNNLHTHHIPIANSYTYMDILD